MIHYVPKHYYLIHNMYDNLQPEDYKLELLFPTIHVEFFQLQHTLHEQELEVDHKRELSEDEQRLLNQKLNRIMEITAAGDHPTVSFTVFEADARKAGGRYVEITDSVKRVDTVNRIVELMIVEGVINRAIKIDDIMDIKIH